MDQQRRSSGSTRSFSILLVPSQLPLLISIKRRRSKRKYILSLCIHFDASLSQFSFERFDSSTSIFRWKCTSLAATFTTIHERRSSQTTSSYTRLATLSYPLLFSIIPRFVFIAVHTFPYNVLLILRKYLDLDSCEMPNYLLYLPLRRLLDCLRVCTLTFEKSGPSGLRSNPRLRSFSISRSLRFVVITFLPLTFSLPQDGSAHYYSSISTESSILHRPVSPPSLFLLSPTS